MRGMLLQAVIAAVAFLTVSNGEAQTTMSNGKETIAIIGTGRMGGAIGPRLAEQGHKVIYGSRSPDAEDNVALVERTGNGAEAMGQAEAAAAADIVLLAVPWTAAEAVAKTIAGSTDGKIVMDVTNALKPAADKFMEPATDTSSGEFFQSQLPGAKVVKAYNTVGFHIIVNPASAGGPVTVPLVGEDADAKARVAEIVQSTGFETIDLGPLRNARATEMMAMLYIIPYLTGRMDEAFEYYFRKGTAPTQTTGVRTAN